EASAGPGGSGTIDVGSMTPPPVARLRPGSAIPDFTVTTIDGQTWKYADHKGKPFVFIGWGTYGRQNQLKVFTDFAQKWGKDPRLSILGAFNARDINEARKTIAERHLDFPQVNGVENDLFRTLDSSWPEAVVISADGQIMQTDLE